MLPQGYVYPNEEVEWGLMIVMYPYITGIVAGVFIVSSLYYAFKIERLAPVGKLSLLASLAFLCFATTPLLLHLGHPTRSFLIMIRPNLSSAMALFGYIYSFFMALLLLEIWFINRPFLVDRSRNARTAVARLFYSVCAFGIREIPEQARRIDEKIITLLAGIGIPAACVLTGYVGFIFGAIKANVWWFSPLTPVIFMISAAVSGIATLILPFQATEGPVPGTASREPPNFRRMIDPDAALRLVLKSATRLPSQRLLLDDTCGLRLAEEVHADRDYPPFARAMMDGYAVRAGDAGRTVEVVGEVAAGEDVNRPVAEGRCLEIMTGAPCPPGTEAVVPKEYVRGTGNGVTLPKRILAGSHVAPRGSECRAGAVVLRPGDTITPLAAAVFASLGLETVLVTPRPSLAVISTGAELVPPGRDLGPGQIRDSNGPMLLAMARDMGIDQPPRLHVADSREDILHALSEVADCDIVVLSGGVSVGNYDLVPESLRSYGAELVFHKVKQKPGKPLLLAKKGSQLLFGLPGNPLACHLCFHRYVATAIRLLEGKSPVSPPGFGRLAESVQPKAGRTYFVAALAEQVGETPDAWRLHPLPGVSSADVFAPCQANCYIEVPPGNTRLATGEILAFTWIGDAPWPN